MNHYKSNERHKSRDKSVFLVIFTPLNKLDLDDHSLFIVADQCTADQAKEMMIIRHPDDPGFIRVYEITNDPSTLDALIPSSYINDKPDVTLVKSIVPSIVQVRCLHMAQCSHIEEKAMRHRPHVIIVSFLSPEIKSLLRAHLLPAEG